MRIAKALVLVLVAACGGSQDAPTTVTTGPEGPAPDDPAVTTGEETPVETPAPKPEPPKPLTLEERIAFHDGCFKSFLAEEPDFFARCYTEESSDDLVDSGDPVANGVAGIAASSKPFWDGFTLTGAGVLNLGNGDNVVSVAVVSATHDGEFNGMPATNKTTSMLVAEIQNLDEKGRHGDVRTYIDLGTMMGQLGMAPKGAKVRKPAAMPAEPVRTIVATGAESETANVDAVRVGFDLFNKHDWKALTAVYAADAVLSDQSAPADYAGSKAIEKQFKEIGKAFPDVKEEITAIWGAGDYVVAESTLTGTNKAAAPGRGIKKATKKPVTLRTAHVFQMEGGKVKQHWVFANGMAMAMQLGLIKPPPAAKPSEKAAEPAAEKTDKPAEKSDKKPAKKGE